MATKFELIYKDDERQKDGTFLHYFNIVSDQPTEIEKTVKQIYENGFWVDRVWYPPTAIVRVSVL